MYLRSLLFFIFTLSSTATHALVAVNDSITYDPFDTDAPSLYVNDILLNDDTTVYSPLCVRLIDNIASDHPDVNAVLQGSNSLDTNALNGVTDAFNITYSYTVGQGDSSSCAEITDISNTAELTADVTIAFPAQEEVVADDTNTSLLLGTLNIEIPDDTDLTKTEEELLTSLDNVCSSSTDTTIQAQCSDLSGSTTEEILASLQSITPDQINGAVRTAESTSQIFTDDISKRMQSMRTGGSNIAVSNLNVMIDGESIPLGKLLQSYINEGSAGDDFSKWGGFVKGTLGYGKRKDNNDENGYKLDIYNLTLGADYRFNPSLFGGVALGYTNNKTDFNNDRGDFKSSNWLLSAFTNYYPTQQWYIDGLVSVGFIDTKNNRKFTAGGSEWTATGDNSGAQFSVAASTGYQYFKDAWSLTPYAQLEWIYTSLDQYEETGSGLYDLTYEEQQLNRSHFRLGGQAAYTISTQSAVWIPSVFLDWQYQIHRDDEDYLTYLSNDPSKSKVTLTPAYEDKNFFNLGLSLTGTFAHGISAYATYDTILAKKHEYYHGLTIGARMEF